MEIESCALFTKMRLSQDYVSGMELLKKYFLQDMKNANKAMILKVKYFFQNYTEDRMTHFNVSIAVKLRKDNDKQNNELSYKRFKGLLLYRQKFPRGEIL